MKGMREHHTLYRERYVASELNVKFVCIDILKLCRVDRDFSCQLLVASACGSVATQGATDISRPTDGLLMLDTHILLICIMVLVVFGAHTLPSAVRLINPGLYVHPSVQPSITLRVVIYCMRQYMYLCTCIFSLPSLPLMLFMSEKVILQYIGFIKTHMKLIE